MMGTNKLRRLEKVEKTLTPRDLVDIWLSELANFDSFEAYVLRVADDCAARALPIKLLKQAINGASKGSRGRPGQFSQQSVKSLSEAYFQYELVLRTNLYIHELLQRQSLAVAMTALLVLDTQEKMRRITKYFKVWCALSEGAPAPRSKGDPAVAPALQNDVTGFDDLAAIEIPRWLYRHFGRQNLSADEFRAGRDALEAAIGDLVQSGLLRRGSKVRLSEMTSAVLREAPLLAGEWLDQAAVEEAERFALLGETFELKTSVFGDPVVPFQPQRIDSAGNRVDASWDEADALLDVAVTPLSRFPGRTKEIAGGRCVHVDDYRAWPERKAGGNLELVHGIVTASWNSWLAANGGEEHAKLAGIRVSKMDPERRMRRRATLSNKRWTVGDDPTSGPADAERTLTGLRSAACCLLTEIRASVLAVARHQNSYFSGRTILFRAQGEAPEGLAALASQCVEDYNQLHEYVAVSAYADELVGRAGKLSHDVIEQAAQRKSKVIVKQLIDTAMAGAISLLGDKERALQARKSLAFQDGVGRKTT